MEHTLTMIVETPNGTVTFTVDGDTIQEHGPWFIPDLYSQMIDSLTEIYDKSGLLAFNDPDS